jgi:hypothetical protein
MSDTEQQAKATTPDDVVMEEEDAPITDGQEPVAAEEAKESDDKDKETTSKPKSKTSQPAKKGNGTSSRKMAGKFAKAEAKEPGKFKIGDLVTGRVKGFPFWREFPFLSSVLGLRVLLMSDRGSRVFL